MHGFGVSGVVLGYCFGFRVSAWEIWHRFQVQIAQQDEADGEDSCTSSRGSMQL